MPGKNARKKEMRRESATQAMRLASGTYDLPTIARNECALTPIAAPILAVPSVNKDGQSVAIRATFGRTAKIYVGGGIVAEHVVFPRRKMTVR